MTDTVTGLTVSGGANGTEARFADLAAMGGVADGVAADALGVAAAGHRFLLEPDVLASAVLNPVGVARFEFSMAGALDGPDGLTATSAGIGLRAAALRATEAAYQAADDLAQSTVDGVRWLAGSVLTSGPLLAGGTGALLFGHAYLAGDGDPLRWLVEHPGAVDALVGMAPGMLSNLGPKLDLAASMELLGELYADDPAVVTGGGLDPAVSGVDVPTGLADVLTGLDHRNDSDSNIDVRLVTDASGAVTGVIVDIPGTRDWNLPWQPGGANDTGTNVDAMAGNPTVLQRGIEQALADAYARHGVPADTPVMLAGHSQGGIVAAGAADDLIAAGYQVTHVVTAGSPVGRIDVPDSVRVLSLENSGDLVPHLDATDNPGAANRTTVTFDHQTGTPGGNHAIGDGNYVAAAGELDGSDDPSVRAFLADTDVFLDGHRVGTYEYLVARG